MAHRHSLRPAAILFCGLAAAGIVRAATTQPTTVPALSDVTLDRGDAVRQLLRATLERAYANDERWPDAIDAPAGVTYRRPTKPTTTPARLPDPRTTTIVLEEDFATHADGVWIGYADGRVEFAAARADLDAIRMAASVAAAAREFDETDVGPVDADAAIALRVVDPAGKPVAGASVGSAAFYGDRARDAHGHGPGFRENDAYRAGNTDVTGTLRVAATQPFLADGQFGTAHAAPLIAFDEPRDLIGWAMLERSAYTRDAPPYALRLGPACHIRGVATNLGLRAAGRPQTRVRAIAFVPGQLRQYTILSSRDDDAFDIPLPPGDWALYVYGTDGDGVFKYLRIAPGERERVLHLDLPITRAAELVDRPAPELRAIKAWRPAPLTLASLRGKVVLLDFWGSWCGPCVQTMPSLMKLHDEFKTRGLEVVAVHDDSVASIAEMDAKCEAPKRELWGGRALPFPVALDGGGETRITYTSMVARGATTAAYGITNFPTTLAIGRDGRVIGTFDPNADDAGERLAALLAVITP